MAKATVSKKAARQKPIRLRGSVSSRLPQASESPAPAHETGWAMKGELVLNCNCTVFCPCVISLGKHPPTEGHCQTWGGIRIDEGHFEGEDLSGLNLGLLIEIPGLMARGGWKCAAFIDERASDAAFEGLKKIMTGQAGGTTGLFQILVAEFLGAERAPVSYEVDGKTRRITVGRKIQGEIVPVPGHDPDRDLVVTNTQYWMGPDVTVATARKGRVRAFGRVWDFEGRSAEIVKIDWGGPAH